ncbi:MAG: YihY/virulence factor BrkB family protein [Gemmatimonadetes bacterium]|nr:YihY/virulence factor BrkB family protein [Gemmatimonadota bacterium]
MPAIKEVLGVVKGAAKDFGDDSGTSMAAAVSYYTVFSLPPLLGLILLIASLIMNPETIRGLIQGEFASMIGADASEAIGTMLQNAKQPGSGGPVAAILGVVALLFGAAGAFNALQQALNRAWEVAPDPNAGGLKNLITKRIFSFGMVLGIVFLLMVSLAASAALHAFGGMLGGFLPGGADTVVAEILNNVISLVVFSLLFAAMFKVIPDAKISWRDVRVGGFATALLFVVGKFLIGLYLGRSDPGSAFGAAGSLAIILVWIYYSAIIVILGAEFTQAWATTYGSGIEPEPGAVRLVDRKEPVTGTAEKKKEGGKPGKR